ncbi:Fn3 associated [Lachnospiraceae bacterium]|nr:Fn3 associated [Lachnospiraceae bacterium]
MLKFCCFLSKRGLSIPLLIIVAVCLFLLGMHISVSENSQTIPSPVFSKTSGFFDDPFDLSISTRSDLTIHYTMDSTDPTMDSPIYTEPISVTDLSSEPNLYANNPQISVDYFSYSKRHGYALPESPVDKCTVVRAAAFDSEGNRSDIVTASYFIGYQNRPQYDGYGIISLVSDPSGLFGDDNGIFVIGRLGKDFFKNRLMNKEKTAAYLKEHPDTPLDGSVSVCGIGMEEAFIYNYSQSGSDWERETNATFFDEWQLPLVSTDIGLRIRGNNSRNFPQKSMALFQRDLYSDSRFYYPYLQSSVKDTVAISGGADDMYTNVRDKFCSKLFSSLNFGNMEFSAPIYVFLDGEFWGTYLMSEKQNAEYIQRHYNVDANNVLVVKNGELSDGSESAFNELYGEFRDFLRERDFTTEETYKDFCKMVDIDSLLDYYAARLYVDEGNDWPKSNVAIWRTVKTDKQVYADGKWRFLNFDNNSELLSYSIDADALGRILEKGEGDEEEVAEDWAAGRGYKMKKFERLLFYELMKNQHFRSDFLARFTEIADTVYDPDNAISILDSVAEEMRYPIVIGYSRWYGDRCSFNDFDSKIEEMRTFLRERRQYILPAVQKACS